MDIVGHSWPELSDRSKNVHFGGGPSLDDVTKILWRLVKVGPMAMVIVGHSSPYLNENLPDYWGPKIVKLENITDFG